MWQSHFYDCKHGFKIERHEHSPLWWKGFVVYANTCFSVWKHYGVCWVPAEKPAFCFYLTPMRVSDVRLIILSVNQISKFSLVQPARSLSRDNLKISCKATFLHSQNKMQGRYIAWYRVTSQGFTTVILLQRPVCSYVCVLTVNL